MVRPMRDGRARASDSGTKPPGEWARRLGLPGACLFLAALCWAVFRQVLRHEFVNYDDDLYVYENYTISGGLSWQGVGWAFGRLHGELTYWHPLTWVSHMLDCQLYGLRPWGHHLTNVLLHVLNVLLVFLVLRRMTGAYWRCLVLAALFAVHPLQVDTVAWVAERKNLLGALFWLLTTWAYLRYVEVKRAKPKVQSPDRTDEGLALAAASGSRGEARPSGALFWYCVAVALFACGLMCKPVLVTLPFVLLLLDYWPLRRFQPAPADWQISRLGRLTGEKAPLFLLACASSLVTVAGHHSMGLLSDSAARTLDGRMENALVSYLRYLGKTFWPSNLAVFYPYPAAWAPGLVGLSGVLLCAISVLAASQWRRRPWLCVGWCWFLGVLVPFIGLVQAGEQAMADRFMYLPLVGLLIIVVWGGTELGGQWPRWIRAGLAGAGIAALAVGAHRQAGYWRDSATLWSHALACTQDNVVAEANLGLVRLDQGRPAEAIALLQKALDLQPGLTAARTGVAYALLKQGKLTEAVTNFQAVLDTQPNAAEALAGLANALLRQGQTNAAIARWEQALVLKPAYPQARGNLGDTLLQLGRTTEAISQYEQLVQLEPADPQAQFNLGCALAATGRVREAVAHYRAALKTDAHLIPPLNNLAWILATCPDGSLRNGAEAVKLAQEANRIAGGGQAGILDTLAAAYAEAGRFPEAVETAERALQLADSQGNKPLAERLQKKLGLYQTGLPYHTKS